MNFYIFFILYNYLNLSKFNSITFNLSNDSYLRSFNSKEKVGEALIYTYRPNNKIGSIKFTEDHSLELPPSNKIVRLKIITKDEVIELLHITYADLSNENILEDLYYHKANGEFKKIESDLFYVILVKLSKNYKTFNLISSSSDWYSCYEGLTEKKLCSVHDYYFVKKIVMGNKTLWENKSHFNVHSIELGLKEIEENKFLKLKIYCNTKSGQEIIEDEFPLTETEFKTIKPLIELRDTKTIKPVQNQISKPRVVHTIDTQPLKEIKLYFESDERCSKNCKVRHNILLGLDNTYYETTPGVEIKCIKDGNTVVWYPSAKCVKFIHARFTHIKNSPLLLNIRYITEKPKRCFGTTSVETNEFFIKDNEWHTTTEDKYNKKIEFLMNKTTKDTLDSGVSYEYVSPPEETVSDIPDDSKHKNRLKDVKLELDPVDPNGYNRCQYLMDGLDTFFYDPKEGKVVKSVMDGSRIIWSYDNNQRKLKHAKFAYKGDSHIYLIVLYSVDDGKSGSSKQVNKNDYFVKRDQWYHSPEKDFFDELDSLKNKVTLRDVILNEKKSLEEHVTDLKFTTIQTQSWTDKLLRRRPPSPPKIEPFEYNIRDSRHDHLLVEANLKEKFAIYTPETGYALTRLFDDSRLIWYQKNNGLGCTTFYMDLSGEHPLLHLMLDDPVDSNIYYKKVDGTWHIIDKHEYERIRKPPNGQASPNDFRSV